MIIDYSGGNYYTGSGVLILPFGESEEAGPPLNADIILFDLFITLNKSSEHFIANTLQNDAFIKRSEAGDQYITKSRKVEVEL